MFKISEISNKGKYKYCVDTRVCKKGVYTGRRHYFKTKTAANDFLEDIIKSGDLEKEQQPKIESVLIDDIYDDFAEKYV